MGKTVEIPFRKSLFINNEDSHAGTFQGKIDFSDLLSAESQFLQVPGN
jgi:hypothetical protein